VCVLTGGEGKSGSGLAAVVCADGVGSGTTRVEGVEPRPSLTAGCSRSCCPQPGRWRSRQRTTEGSPAGGRRRREGARVPVSTPLQAALGGGGTWLAHRPGCLPPRAAKPAPLKAHDCRRLALASKVVMGSWMTLVLERISLNTAPCVCGGGRAGGGSAGVGGGVRPGAQARARAGCSLAACTAWGCPRCGGRGRRGRGVQARGASTAWVSLACALAAGPPHLDGLALLAVVPDVLGALGLGIHAHNDHAGLRGRQPAAWGERLSAAAAAAAA
jgi:hypothetical protein